jgi:hypothetical protein
MAEDRVLANGEVGGGDPHNQFASFVAKGGAFAVVPLRKVAQFVALDIARGPIVIADDGSSQGRSLLRPIRAQITGLSRCPRRECSPPSGSLFASQHGDPRAHAVPA